MNTDKTCDELLDSILKELELTKAQGIEISRKLNEQTDTMNDTTKNLDTIEQETEMSAWYINYMKATFGKIYKKIHRFPERVKSGTIRRRLKLKADLLLFKRKSYNTPPVIPEYVKTDKLSIISNMLTDIKTIANVNNNELDKQNKIIDYNTEMADMNEENIFHNRLKIRKILD